MKCHFEVPETVWLTKQFIYDENWHDLALFTTALDTALRACDLLQLRVADVCYSNGRVRRKLARRQQKTGQPVEPVLTPDTQQALAQWIQTSGKSRDEFLFTRTKKGRHAKPITRYYLSQLVKKWAEALGHPPDDYACHSLRRTRGVQMYDAGERVADISKMYGHVSEASTLLYLGITQRRVTDMCLRHGLKLNFNQTRSQSRLRLPQPQQRQTSRVGLTPDLAPFCPNAVKT